MNVKQISFPPLHAPRVQKRFEKTRSRMVYHAIKGVWGCFPNKPHRELWHHDAPLAISERIEFFTWKRAKRKSNINTQIELKNSGVFLELFKKLWYNQDVLHKGSFTLFQQIDPTHG